MVVVVVAGAVVMASALVIEEAESLMEGMVWMLGEQEAVEAAPEVVQLESLVVAAGAVEVAWSLEEAEEVEERLSSMSSS